MASVKRACPVPVMNVTPLVDVVLVLLIIFMVVIPMMETNPHVVLPDIFHPDEEAKGKTDPFTLSITAEGDMFFEKKELLPDALEAQLRAANQKEPTRRLVLRADRNTKYRAIRELLKVTQTVGFPGLSMRVNALDASSKP
jgi:biopolymer transport protein TolR